MSWTNDVVLEFLELYRREQLLWDPKHPLSRSRTENTNAWLRIQSDLSINCSIVDLKKKKESLMTSFRLHYKKKRTQSGYCTTWFAFPLMESFLSEKYECDSTNQIDQEFFTNNGTYETQPPIPDHNVNRNSASDKRNTKMTAITQSNLLKMKANSSSSEFIYKKKQTDDNNKYKRTAEDKIEIDEYELYGQLLAKKLRKLEENQRDIVMHDIDNIMFRAKMQSGSAQTRSYSSSPTPISRKMKSPIFIATPQNTHQYEDENTSYHDHLSQTHL